MAGAGGGGSVDGTAGEPAEGGGAEAVAAKVLIIPEGPRLGIISDIDDTAMVTHVPRVLVAAWNQLVKYSSAREPVPGMAELYSRIQSAHPGTPLMYLTKAQTWALADELGALDYIREQTHTCYNGIVGGCHECPSCVLRERGLAEYLESKKAV